jgi:hypothetical protein
MKCVVDEVKSKEVESAELSLAGSRNRGANPNWEQYASLIACGTGEELYYVLYYSTVYIMLWDFQSVMAGPDGIFCAWQGIYKNVEL